MKIYLVRHGRSVSNTKDLIQDGEDPLSEEGLQQAIFLGQRFKNIPVDIIFSSDFQRAYETAEQIGLNTDKKINILEELREHKKPTSLVGKHYEHQEVAEFDKKSKQNSNDPNWRYEDEESFYEFRDRVLRVLDFIKQRDEKNIVLVSHGLTIRMILALILISPKLLTSEIFDNFKHKTKTLNTGITVIEANPTRNNNLRLVTFNDIAHLGE